MHVKLKRESSFTELNRLGWVGERSVAQTLVKVVSQREKILEEKEKCDD